MIPSMVKASVGGWSKVTKNGQVTLPKSLRKKLDLKPGKDLVQFLITENDVVVIKKFELAESINLGSIEP